MNYIESKLWYCAAIGRDLMIESEVAWIATNAWTSYRYAYNILEGRFELGDEVIATSAQVSYWYARYVLRGRFELGEDVIVSDSHYKRLYNELMVELGIDFELH